MNNCLSSFSGFGKGCLNLIGCRIITLSGNADRCCVTMHAAPFSLQRSTFARSFGLVEIEEVGISPRHRFSDGLLSVFPNTLRNVQTLVDLNVSHRFSGTHVVASLSHLLTYLPSSGREVIVQLRKHCNPFVQ